ncbi:unnamed protein product [Durusdinium trenchii]|uniref:Uncharacterized protein n=2 Tax=Durusdinium trenchii TaxID=1381693 RepID=A0ABP0SK07_9DINO|eukprot:g9950.t1
MELLCRLQPFIESVADVVGVQNEWFATEEEMLAELARSQDNFWDQTVKAVHEIHKEARKVKQQVQTVCEVFRTAFSCCYTATVSEEGGGDPATSHLGVV